MPIDMSALNPAWWWLILALLLAIAEVILPGFFLIWLAAAAGLVAAATWIFGLNALAQAVVFAIAAVSAVYLGRSLLRRNPATPSDPHLNDRTARLIGEIVLVVESIESGTGRVRVGDGVWTASGPDAVAGARVRIVGARGSTLLVETV